MKFVNEYLRVDHTGKPVFSGSQFDLLGADEDAPNWFTAADLLAPSLLSAELTGHTINRLLVRDARAAAALLEQIPNDLDIVDASEAQLNAESPAGQLWHLVRSQDDRDGAGPTTTSKILARKRPRLLAIWDTFIERATGLDTIQYWVRLRDALQSSAHGSPVWDWLGEVQDEAPDAGHLSRLRVLDIVLWMSVHTGARNA